jgi:hypothetical protein
MTTVQRITPHLRDVEAPAAIRDLPAWLLWRFEAVPGGGKPRKVPYYANGGRRAGEQGSPGDVSNLVTFDAAKAAAARRGFDGVGFAALPSFGICALDFDNCITNGQIHPDVEPLLADTYAEFSPSGQGVRLFFKGDLGNGKALRDGPFGMECFSTRGFVTFTGNTLDITELLGNTDTVAPINDTVLNLHSQRFQRVAQTLEAPASGVDPVGLLPVQVDQLLTRLDPDMPHDDWLHVGMGLHHETRGEGFDLWDAWSARSSKYPGADALRQRWDSFGRHNDRTVTLRTAMHMAGMTFSGPASADEFEAMVESDIGNPISETKPPRFVFEPVHEFSSTTALPWIIKGVLPKAALGVVYGASGSGKSFAALDMAMAIARGAEWRGRRVRQSRVAYVAAEGADGFRKRVAAYSKHHGVDLASVPMTVLNGAPNLLEVKDAKDIVVGIRASGGADLIIVDTFAQTTPGANENAGEDVGKALGHCKRIHEVTGALVLLIHHSGKDSSKGARGWSGLRAAADAEIEVVREGDARALRLTKSKDGVDDLAWGFTLNVVQLGVDEDLDPITSCVVEEAALPPVGGNALRKMGKNEKVVNEVIQEMAQAQSEGIEVGAVILESVRRIKERDGIQDDKKGNCKTLARRALNSLCEGDDAPYWLDVDTNTVSVC